jgi:hypothetical protein
MLKELIKLANELDGRGLAKEALAVDKLIAVAAQGPLRAASPSYQESDPGPQTVGEQVVTRNMWDQELWPGVKLWVEQYVKMMTPGGN